MKNIKKSFKMLTLVLAATIMLSSCATLFGGSVTEAQRMKPGAGQPQRKVRVIALVLDLILFSPMAIVDFATGAIYQPSK